nr:MAG TPA: hypothetical protein [Caudoviricetes sp.]
MECHFLYIFQQILAFHFLFLQNLYRERDKRF